MIYKAIKTRIYPEPELDIGYIFVEGGIYLLMSYLINPLGKGITFPEISIWLCCYLLACWCFFYGTLYSLNKKKQNLL